MATKNQAGKTRCGRIEVWMRRQGPPPLRRGHEWHMTLPSVAAWWARRGKGGGKPGIKMPARGQWYGAGGRE